MDLTRLIEMLNDLSIMFINFIEGKDDVDKADKATNEIFVCEATQYLYDKGIENYAVEASLLSGVLVVTVCEGSSFGAGGIACGVAGIGMAGTMYFSIKDGIEGLDNENKASDLCYSIFNSFKKTGVIEGAKKYQVQDGDTVWDLAKERGMSVNDVIALNPWLKDEGRISNDGSFILITSTDKLILDASLLENGNDSNEILTGAGNFYESKIAT